MIAASLDPWWHFLNHGLKEGRQPGPRFVPDLYLKANPDVQQASISPLLHFLETGYGEGRSLTPTEKEQKQPTGSSWPEAPIPVDLPDWFGSLPVSLSSNSAAEKLRILFCLSVQSGGTPQTNQDLMSALSDIAGSDVETFVLYCNKTYMVLYLFLDGIYVPLEIYILANELGPFPHTSDEFDHTARRWLGDYWDLYQILLKI